MTISPRAFRSACDSACGLTVLLLLSLIPITVRAQTTTISGTVYAPNGVDPLSNMLVYTTTSAVAPLVSGANCPGANCLTSSSAVPSNALVSTYTAVDGSFTLTGVAEDTTYTLVIQAGKWRRQFTEAVTSSPLTGLALSMPSTHAEGDIPLIAISTGSVDAMECVLRDVGIADSEFTDDNGSSGGRIHLYKGDQSAGAEINASTPSENVLMSNATTLDNYDMVMFPCQGSTNAESSSSIDNLLAYTSAGGRVFATHDSRVWLSTSTAVGSGPYAGATFSGVATWNAQANLADGIATVNTGFQDGALLAQWLQNAGKSAGGTLGQVAISTLRHDTTGIIAPTQSWLTLNSDGAIMQFTFNTPVGAAAADQYGRVLYNEYHVENTSGAGGKVFPHECGSSPYTPVAPSAMSPQEKMLEYSLFDLSNFVTPIVVPTATITITTNPANSIFTEGDTDDTLTFDATNTSQTVAIDSSVVLSVTLPAGLTATAMTDTAGGWICDVGTLSCTRTTSLAAGASDSVVVTVTVAGNATGGAATTTPTVAAELSSPVFSTNVTQPISLTLEQHAAVTWAPPAAISTGTALSSTQLNAIGNTTGTYVYSPPSGTLLSAGSHTLTVTFTPSDQDTYPGTATATVTLVVDSSSATASAPAATSFGPIPVATTSSSESLTFTLLTAGEIGSPVVVTQGALSSDFADAGSGTCETNGTSHAYSANDTCTMTVTFTPGYPGLREGAVLLEDSMGNVLATGYVYGTGTGPLVNFLPGAETSRVTVSNGIANPQGLALDGGGNLYTADATNHAIYRTTPGGVTSSVLDLSAAGTVPATPKGLAVDGAGNLFIADSANGQVIEANPSGSGYVLNASRVGTGLSGSEGVAVDPAGNVYIADTGNNRILVETLQANGSYAQTVAVTASTSVLGSTLSAPAGVAADLSGNIYIADTANNRVLKETDTAGTYSPSLVAGSLDWPTQLILDGGGNVYFANSGHSSASNSRIYKETASGGSYVQMAVPVSTTSSSLWGVAVAGSGNVYLSDVTDVKVLEEIFAAAPSLSFASTAVGSTSSDSPQTLAVENVGNTALMFTSSGLVAPADFHQGTGSGAPPDCANSATVAAGAACSLALDFEPTTTGTLLSELFTLADNSLNASPAIQEIAMNGPATASLVVVAPSGSSLAAGTVGVTYSSLTFTATGGTGPYTFAFTGTLPPGLTLSSAGVLSGTPTAAGSDSFVVIATDTVSATGSRSYSVVISGGTATVTLGSLAQTYTGSPLAATDTTSPANLMVNLVYTGTNGTTYGPSSTPPTGAGSYTVVGTVSDSNYSGTGTGTLVIAKAVATVTLGSLAQTYTGSPLAATDTTSPANLMVNLVYTGTNGTTYGPSSTPPTGAGSYTVVGTVSNSNDNGSGTGTLVIAKAVATVTLGNLTQTYTGSPLAVTTATNPQGLLVIDTYTGSGGTIYGPSSTPPTQVGSYAVAGVISDGNYSGTGAGTLMIIKEVATVTLSHLAQLYTGSPVSALAATTPPGLTINLTYTGMSPTTYGTSPSPPTQAGSYAVSANISDVRYSGGSTGTLVIAPAGSAVAVASSSNPVLSQNPVTFTATVSSTVGAPSGMVSFLDGSATIGQGTVSGGQAVLTTSALASGVHTISAVYSGNTDFASAASTPLSQTVLDFNLTPAPTGGGGGSGGGGSGGGGGVPTQTTTAGGVATYPLNLLPTSGVALPAPVVLTASGLPPGSTATISTAPWTQLTATSWSFPAGVPLGQFNFTIQLASPSARLDVSPGMLTPALLCLLLWPFARGLRRAGKGFRGGMEMLLLVAMATAMVGMNGCGAGSGLFGPQGKTYSVTLTATSGNLTHSTSITLVVQ